MAKWLRRKTDQFDSSQFIRYFNPVTVANWLRRKPRADRFDSGRITLWWMKLRFSYLAL